MARNGNKFECYAFNNAGDHEVNGFICFNGEQHGMYLAENHISSREQQEKKEKKNSNPRTVMVV